MKHSHDFCFTSVIAYNSMKLQPELISLAADKGSCQVWRCVITQGDQKEGGWQTPDKLAPGRAASSGCPGGMVVVLPGVMAPLATAGLDPAVMELGKAGEGWARCTLRKAQIWNEHVTCPFQSILSLSFGGLIN